jgi:TolB-like protein
MYPAAAATGPDTVGVLQFTNISQSEEYSGLGDGIAENLVNDLKSANFVVVDRLSLKEIIKKIEFSLSDLADEKNAPQIGNLSGAKYLITGSYQIVGKNIRKCSSKITGAMDSIDDHTNMITRLWI